MHDHVNINICFAVFIEGVEKCIQLLVNMVNTVLKRAYCDHIPTLIKYIIRVVQVCLLAITMYQLNLQWRGLICIVVMPVTDKLIYGCKRQSKLRHCYYCVMAIF